MTVKQRNALLEIDDRRGRQIVLEDNYLQAQALSIMTLRRCAGLASQRHIIETLEARRQSRPADRAVWPTTRPCSAARPMAAA